MWYKHNISTEEWLVGNKVLFPDGMVLEDNHEAEHDGWFWSDEEPAEYTNWIAAENDKLSI